MITVYSWDPACKAGRWLDGEALRKEGGQLRASPAVLWVDLEAPDPAEEDLVLRDFFGAHPLTVEDVTRLRRFPGAAPHFPKVEEFADYLFVVLNPLGRRFLGGGRGPHPPVGDEGPCTQLSALLTRTVLLTHHYEPLVSVEGLRSFLNKHETQAGRGPDYLFHLVLDGMVDQYAPVLDTIDDELDDMEAEVLRRPSPGMLSRLLEMKRRIITLRKTLVYEREVLARLARGEFGLIGEREMAYYRNVYDHLVRFTELLEASREVAGDLTQTHLAAASNRLNEVMKVLTMISTVILPMTLISSIYGMNFQHMPELGWEFGYPTALCLMALTAGGALGFFRWKGWI